VGTGSWNAFGELPRLRLPDDDDRIIVTLHTYEPFNFTHQSAPWAGNEVSKLKGVVFPGPPATPMTAPEGVGSVMRQWIESYNTEPTASNPCAPGVFLPNFDLAKAWSDYYGRPVHVGEFGAMKVADPASRVNYYGAIRRELEKRGMGWAIWDWKAYFALMKEVEPGRFEEVSPGMRDALLGK
jgi:endoglucanase